MKVCLSTHYTINKVEEYNPAEHMQLEHVWEVIKDLTFIRLFLEFDTTIDNIPIIIEQTKSLNLPHSIVGHCGDKQTCLTYGLTYKPKKQRVFIRIIFHDIVVNKDDFRDLLS